MDDPNKHEVRTHEALVVGGGLAGLVAAATLADVGVPVVVLEGSSRPGGWLAPRDSVRVRGREIELSMPFEVGRADRNLRRVLGELGAPMRLSRDLPAPTTCFAREVLRATPQDLRDHDAYTARPLGAPYAAEIRRRYGVEPEELGLAAALPLMESFPGPVTEVRDPMRTVIEPLRARIEAAGGRVVCNARAVFLLDGPAGVAALGIEREGEREVVAARATILATDAPALEALRGTARAAFDPAPLPRAVSHIVARLWFEHGEAVLPLSGDPRREAESLPDQTVLNRAEAQVRERMPSAGRLLAAHLLRTGAVRPAPAPGEALRAPTVSTRRANLAVCGDCVRGPGLGAERAVATALYAARRVAGILGVCVADLPEPIVPPSPTLAGPLARAASRFALSRLRRAA